jgi:predicted Zn finger-like uncharacterized protein
MKVNCPGCERAYKIDDHRVPPSGLKMRCPQCSTSFLVSTEGGVEPTDSLPPSIAPPGSVETRPSILPKRPIRPTRPPRKSIGTSAQPPISIPPPDVSDLVDDGFGDLDLPPTNDSTDLPPTGNDVFPAPGDSFDDFDLDAQADPLAGDLPMPNTAQAAVDARGKTMMHSSGGDPFGDIDIMAQGQTEDPLDALGESPSPSDLIGNMPSPDFQDMASSESSGAVETDAFGDINLDSLPPLGSSMDLPEGESIPPELDDQLSDPVNDSSPDSIDDDEFDLPSPAEALGPSNTEMMVPDENMTRVQTSGSTDFGEVNLGPASGAISENDLASVDLPQAESDDGEFDGFPTSSAEPTAPESTRGSQLDLDSDVLGDAKKSTMLPQETSGEDAKRKKDQKPTGAFTGRRKLERQSRRSKWLLLSALIILVVAGSGLAFTPLGPFGAYALYKLLPKTNEDEIIQQAEKSMSRNLRADTPQDLLETINQLEQFEKELNGSEDIQLLNVYMHYWYQVRFGLDKNHDKLAATTLGSTNLDESESPYALLAKTSRDLRLNKEIILTPKTHAALSKQDSGIALLFTIFLRSGDNEKALAAAKQLDAKEKSPRSGYLLAQALLKTNQLKPAISRLESTYSKNKNHADTILLLAESLLNNRPVPKEKILALTKHVIDAHAMTATPLHKAHAYAMIGQLRIGNRRFDEAAASIKKAEELDPENVTMLLGKGVVGLYRGDLSMAGTAFNKAAANQPHNLLAKLGQAETTLREGNISEANSLVDGIIETHPKNAQIHYLKGEIFFKLKKNIESEKEYRTAIELDTELLDSYIALSRLYFSDKRDSDAMLILDQASEAVPNSPLISQTIADAQAARGDYASAIIELNKSLDLDPDNLRSHFRMAQMYRKMESFDDASRSLDEVQKRNPEFSGLAMEQGLLLELSGDTQKALAAYKKALAEKPGDNSLKLRVGAASHALGDNASAEKLLIEVASANPDSAEAHYYYGEVLRVTGRSAEATKILHNAVSLEDTNALYHLRYGMALKDSNDLAQAMIEFRIAEKLDDKIAEIYLRIGEIQLRQGTVRDAIGTFDKGLSIDPRLIEAYRYVGEAFEQLGDLRASVAYYRRAVKEIPDDSEIFFKLGLAELSVYGNRVAIASLSRAVQLEKSSESPPLWLPEALFRLGVAQASTGAKGLAITTFKHYLEVAPTNHMDRSEVKGYLDRLGG